MRSVAILVCAAFLLLYDALPARAANAKSAPALVADLNRLASQIAFSDEDDIYGPFNATLAVTFALGDAGVLTIRESHAEEDIETGEKFSLRYAYTIPLRRVQVAHDHGDTARSLRTKAKLERAVLACDGSASCIRQTKESDHTWSGKISYKLYCEPAACGAIEADLRQLVALARGQAAPPSADAPVLPDTAAGLVQRLNALTVRVALKTMTKRGDDTVRMSNSIGYASQLLAADGTLRIRASGKIDGQFEKSGKRTVETIDEVAAIPLGAVTVRPNPKVIGTGVPDGDEIRLVALSCERGKGCIAVTPAKGEPEKRDSYSLVCRASACDELVPLLQNLIATAGREGTAKPAGEQEVKKGSKSSP
jgi:hypothetical protein